ncbi:hypothetical protein BDA96_03G447700 [Sorghum bicolor]|uniref:Uncharacterized protein n=1 Tax=Sorghum bicolor TaxID=4558 RepID=A0A921UT81_SORBI|nr:hypothetical protein BDA96_03G447700 [Sorghum bicolor]
MVAMENVLGMLAVVIFVKVAQWNYESIYHLWDFIILSG